MLIDVFGDDNSQVGHLSNGDRDTGQRHDIGVDLKPSHADEAHRYRHRERYGHNDAGTDVQQEEYDDDSDIYAYSDDEDEGSSDDDVRDSSDDEDGGYSDDENGLYSDDEDGGSSDDWAPVNDGDGTAESSEEESVDDESESEASAEPRPEPKNNVVPTKSE